jgi:serine/threonine protein kinase
VSLKTLLDERRVTVDEAIALGRFLLGSAQQLIGLDLVHGDIKPENILMCGRERLPAFKLVDFGSITEVFSTTSRAGTASYLAPERFRGAAIAERTEIFSIGATLFQALTQALPFGEIERFQNPRFGSPRKPVALNPNLPAWLESVLLRAICADPEKRYQNYSEMLFDLDHPDGVEPFREPGAPAAAGNSARFFKAGFFVLLALCLYLLARLLRLP